MAQLGVRIVRIRNPDAFELPAMASLFERALKRDDHADSDSALDWCSGLVADESFFVAIAIVEEGMVGLTIASFYPGPFNLDPISIFTYSGHRDAYDRLILSLREWSLAVSGTNAIDFVNTSGRTDEWYIERIRRFMSGRVIGSLVHCEWLQAAEMGQEGEIWVDSHSEAQVRSQGRWISHRQSSRPNAASSQTNSPTGLRAAVRRWKDRLLRRSRQPSSSD